MAPKEISINLLKIIVMKKNYQIPSTDVVLFASTDIMQLSVASGELTPGIIGNAPRRRNSVF